MKCKFTILAALTILFAVGIPAAVFSSDGLGDNLSSGEIFKKAQEKYASLTSYSDEGKVVSISNGITITTTFTIKLARPNLYRIEWERNTEFFKTKAKVWSMGKGDFLDMGNGAQKQENQEMALAGATGISGGAAASIPGTFFKQNWGNLLSASAMDEKRQSDEKIGDIDCYVFTHELKDQARTIWIGKQDFLIHQIRDVMSAELMKTALADADKLTTNRSIPLPKIEPQAVTSTETHTNIVINQKFTATDFAPSSSK